MSISTPLFSSKLYKKRYNIGTSHSLMYVIEVYTSDVCFCGLELGSRHINSYLALHSINGDLN
jgi:hypothetical protein